jgi:hypothetical protein
MDHKTLLETNARTLAGMFARIAEDHAIPKVLIAQGIDHNSTEVYVLYGDNVTPLKGLEYLARADSLMIQESRI